MRIKIDGTEFTANTWGDNIEIDIEPNAGDESSHMYVTIQLDGATPGCPAEVFEGRIYPATRPTRMKELGADAQRNAEEDRLNALVFNQ